MRRDQWAWVPRLSRLLLGDMRLPARHACMPVVLARTHSTIRSACSAMSAASLATSNVASARSTSASLAAVAG